MTKSPTDKAAAEPGSNTIILVEPDILVRMIVADYLRSCGYKVIETAAASDVFVVLRAGGSIDIVLAEARLPGDMDGFSLVRQIRETYPNVDTILVTGVAKVAGKAGDLCDEGPRERPYHPREIVRRINLLRQDRRMPK